MNKVFKTLPIHHPLKKWATSWQLQLKDIKSKFLGTDASSTSTSDTNITSTTANTTGNNNNNNNNNNNKNSNNNYTDKNTDFYLILFEKDKCIELRKV